MQTRKLVKAGAASHTVALPKDWLKKNNLEKGNIVYIRELASNELLVSSEEERKQKEEKEITISLEDKKLDTLHRELASAYINNHTTINIIGKELYRNVVEIRNILNNFVALEITEQTSTKIVAKDMLSLKEVSIDKTIRRVDNIIRSVLKDVMEKSADMQDSINMRDSDVNRLYFLLFKIAKGALMDPSISKEVGISSQVDILSYWYLILNLEAIADHSKDIYSSYISLGKDKSSEGINAVLKLIEESYLEVMKSYYGNDKMAADRVASKRIDIFNRCEELSEKQASMHVIRIAENLKDIENSICNISRVVMDKE